MGLRDFGICASGTWDRRYGALDLEAFAGIFKNTTFSYKFYWMEAIVRLMERGVRCASLGEVINEMICSAWYTVATFHVHLSRPVKGEYKDQLEKIIEKLRALGCLGGNEDIRQAIHKFAPQIEKEKVQLTKKVPYRLLAPFLAKAPDKPKWDNQRRMNAFLGIVHGHGTILPYTVEERGDNPLRWVLRFDPGWMGMIRENVNGVLCWIQSEMATWLQKVNPDVPHLEKKMAAPNPDVRRLGHARDLWAGVLELVPMPDAYTGQRIGDSGFVVDCFVPWSYVMHDELWNQTPVDPEIIGAKADALPPWDRFFGPFATNQYLLYRVVREKPRMRALFDACREDNLTSAWANGLYLLAHSREEFNAILEVNMRPIYDAAITLGYERWEAGDLWLPG